VDIRDKELATAYFEAHSRHVLERAVENGEKLIIIFVPADKASVISGIVSDVLPGEPDCSVKDDHLVLLTLEINVYVDYAI
jgi:hypothetical protein